MKAVIQRVSQAQVIVLGKIINSIGIGFLVLLGIEQNDTEKDLEYMAAKIANLRIMADEKGKMNLALKDVGGEILVVSQFTLLAESRKGNRPSFIKAADPIKGEKFYQLFIKQTKALGIKVKTGIFGALMEVKLVNFGPVTIILDSQQEKRIDN